MDIQTSDILNFDKRSTEYSARTNLMPQTHKGDVETAYVVAADDQFEMDRKAYTPLVNYLIQVASDAIKLLREQSTRSQSEQDINIGIVTDTWERGIDEQIFNLPYPLRKLPSGSYIKSSNEK